MKQLDALRAFAVLAVLWSHYVPRKYSFLGINLGEFGVRLFFGLSGFLITGILLASRQRVLSGSENIASALRQFYIRRSLRIFPVFYATLAAMFLLKIPPVRETFAWHVFYLSNFYMAKVGSYPGSVSHLWSLAIEEQFYLFWPWVILWLPRKYLFSAILSLIVAGPLFRVVGVLVNLNDVANRVLTPAAFDSLGCGCLLAYLNGGQRNLTPASRKFINACISVGLPMLFIALVLGYFAYDRMMDTMLTNTAAALTFTWLVARAAEGFRGVTGTVLELRPIVYLGKISYAIYIVHLFVPYVASKVFQKAGLDSGYLSSPLVVKVPFWTGTTIVLAALSWRLFEKPVNNLKNKWSYTRTGARVLTR